MGGNGPRNTHESRRRIPPRKRVCAFGAGAEAGRLSEALPLVSARCAGGNAAGELAVAGGRDFHDHRSDRNRGVFRRVFLFDGLHFHASRRLADGICKEILKKPTRAMKAAKETKKTKHRKRPKGTRKPPPRRPSPRPSSGISSTPTRALRRKRRRAWKAAWPRSGLPTRPGRSSSRRNRWWKCAAARK